MRLDGKHIFITGGTRGIGAAIVTQMAAAGGRVSFSYKTSTDLAAELIDGVQNSYGAQCMAYQCDVADFEATKAVLASAAEKLGPIDVLVNNAGIVRDSPLVTMAREDWAAVLDVNLNGVFNA